MTTEPGEISSELDKAKALIAECGNLDPNSEKYKVFKKAERNVFEQYKKDKSGYQVTDIDIVNEMRSLESTRETQMASKTGETVVSVSTRDIMAPVGKDASTASDTVANNSNVTIPPK